jgi:hypothetical protein
MTPAMLSDQIKAEAEGKETPETPKTPAPEQKSEETPDVKVPPQEETPAPVTPKSEEESEDKKPDEPLQTKRTIYKDYKEKKVELKESKAEIDVLKTQLAEKNTEIENLKRKSEVAETPAEKQEISDEIKAIAEEIGADPEGIAKLTAFITKNVKPGETSALSAEDRATLDRVKHDDSKREATAQFTKEWNAFEPSLKKEFPHVSNEDLAVVREVVDKLAHTDQYHDKEVDYIYFKEKSKLQKFISPKRPSYEGGNSTPALEGGDAEVELSSKSTPMDAQKATQAKGGGSSLEIRSSN